MVKVPGTLASGKRVCPSPLKPLGPTAGSYLQSVSLLCGLGWPSGTGRLTPDRTRP